MNLSELQITTQDGVVLARLTGEVDLSNARGIKEAIVAATPHHARAVLLDLSELDYLDSAGIQLTYELRGQLEVRGQRLGLVIRDGSPAADALRLAGVLERLEIYETVESALGAAREQSPAEAKADAGVPQAANRVEP
jgi:anti-anti-sigma factor